MKIVKPLIITASSILILLLIIALITPPIAKNYIINHSKELTGRQINIQGLYLNIFTGYARITGFQILEKDDQNTFVAFDTLSIDMSVYRLLANEIRINHITLTNPDIQLQQNGSEFNFDDLLTLGQTDSLSTNPSEQSTPTLKDSLSSSNSEEGLAIALYNIHISGGHIRYQDLSRHSIWKMDNFGLQIPGVYFSGKNTDVGIALNFNDGGHLKTAIQYNMEAGNYLLDIDLTNFSIAPIRPYLTDFLNINSINGILNTHLHIEGNAEHVTELGIKGNLLLHQLALTDLKNQPIFAMDSIFIDMENINPGKSIFHFNTIALSGMQTLFDLEKNSNTLTNLLKSVPTDTLTPPQQTIVDTATSIPTPDLKINAFRFNRSFFTFNDHTLHTPFSFHLSNITLTADHLTLDQKNKIKVSSTLQNGGTIGFNYEGKIDDISNTDLLLNIKNLDLKIFTPYSLQYFGYPLQKGILSFSSINNIRHNQLDGRNELSIAKCEVAHKQKEPKPEYNIPLKTALYLIKDKNDRIKINLPVQGNITSPEFSYRKIIFKTFTNLLIKVAVSPVSFLANTLGLSPDKLKNLPFEVTQNDFTPDQLTQINQLAEIIKAKPEMTLVLEQFVNLQQSKINLAHFYVKRNYYLQQHPEKTMESLLPIDYSKITETDIKDIHFLNYVNDQVTEELKTAYLDDQLLSLADSTQLTQLTNYLIDKRNQQLKNYFIYQGVPEKCLRISTATKEKLSTYTGKNQYTINMIFEGDEPEMEKGN